MHAHQATLPPAGSMPLFTFGERLGLILLAQTSAVSACAVVGLLSYIVVGGFDLVEIVSRLNSFLSKV